MLQVPNIRKNLISISLLSHHGLPVVLDSDKMILPKNGTFIGKRYVKDNRLDIMHNNVTKSLYICDVHDTWHCRLHHISEKALDGIINLELVRKHATNMSSSTCEYCVQSKLTS